MTRFLRALLVAAALALGFTARAVDPTWEYSVQVSSTVQAAPAQITLRWPQDVNGVPQNYTVYRKSPADPAWGYGIILPGTTTAYTDLNVVPGVAYEYQVTKAAASYTGTGYIETGIGLPLVDHRGKVLLLVDRTFSTSLGAELARLQRDLAGDGWTVIRHDVARTDSVAAVKSLIVGDYAADPSQVKSVFLFGHVPVPYSGALNPDGHPDHIGAWPADVYYGDVDNDWTDRVVNYTQILNTDSADAARMSNVPGDGKFDQTEIPSYVELQVGRVDLANLPGRVNWGGPATFPSELDLLRKYLNKDHNFRIKAMNPPRRAVLGDYFGARGGEAFAASGDRAFAPLVGVANVRNLNTEFNDQLGVWIPQTAQNDYLLAYGCGAGSYTSMAGLGNSSLYNDGYTTEMVQHNVRGVFNLLFGSWLGDWDHEDDFLRAPLVTDYGLVSVWSGRPHWFIHPLGVGETFGYVTQLTQNNQGLYQTAINSAQHDIHIALMGDPTLRLHAVAPVTALSGAAAGATVSLTWTAAPDSAIVGYHVYRADATGAPFTRLTATPIAGTSFSDTAGSAAATYMVRAIKLESTPSGSYYNAAQGVFWSAAGGASNDGPVTLEAPAAADTTTPVPSIASNPAPSPAKSSSSVGPASNGSGMTLPVVTPLTIAAAAAGAKVLGTATAAKNPAPADVGPTVPSTAADVAWVDDGLPAGAGGAGRGGDSWNWVVTPTPFSGVVAHQSANAAGLHEHFFNWANPALPVNVGDTLYAYVYLDPTNPPSELMLSWAAENWDHRAYWGANQIVSGTDKTTGRFYAGALPPTGKWVRLEIPASAVGLEGQNVQGMSFSTYDGQSTWDKAGKR